MNDLGYKLLVSKSVRRKTTILSMLSESSTPIPLESLWIACQSTKGTVQQDISHLIEMFPNDIELITHNFLPSLKKKATSNVITSYIDLLARDNPLFYVIEQIFQGKKESIEDYAESLYISESTLRKFLTILKDVLAEYDLVLTMNPVDIIGKEINIRYFYFQYFRYSHESSSLSVRDNQFNFIHDTLKKISTSYGLVLNVDYSRIVSWLTIFEQRITLGHKINLEQKLIEKYKYKPSFLKFEAAVRLHFRKINFSLDLSEEELVFAYLTRLDAIIYEKDKTFFSDDVFDTLKEFDHLTTTFLQLANLDICLNISLKTILQAFLSNLTSLTELSPLFQLNHNRLKKIVETNHRETLDTWLEILDNYSTFNNSYDVAISLTLLTESQVQNKKKVLFALTGEPSSITYYKVLALQCVPRGMEAVFIFNRPLNNALLEQLDIDLCIYNLTPFEELTESELFRLSDIPLNSEWVELLTLLHNISQ